MEAKPYIGSDGEAYNNPCTSKLGKQKERWPSERTAWFVAELVSMGLHRKHGRRGKMYPYRCPKCAGYHLTTCRTAEHHRAHAAGIAQLREERNAQTA